MKRYRVELVIKYCYRTRVSAETVKDAERLAVGAASALDAPTFKYMDSKVINCTVVDPSKQYDTKNSIEQLKKLIRDLERVKKKRISEYKKGKET